MADQFNISDVPAAGTPINGCRLTHTVAQNVPDGVATPLAFNTEQFDVGNLHDNAVNNSRITFANGGRFIVGGNIEYETSGGGAYRECRIRLNGTILIGRGRNTRPSGETVVNTTVTERSFSPGDYVELVAFRVGGPAALNVLVTATSSPIFWAQRVS